MNRSFRHIGALLALIALTVGTVQGLWASTCVMEMSVTTASTEVATPFSVCPHDMSTVSSRETSQEEGRTNPPHCPFMPMSMTGSCGSVIALPAHSSISADLHPAEALLPRFAQDAGDLLLAVPFFRPPIA